MTVEQWYFNTKFGEISTLTENTKKIYYTDSRYTRPICENNPEELWIRT